MKQFRTLFLMAFIVAIYACSPPAKEQKSLSTDPYTPDSTLTACLADSGWFKMVGGRRWTPPPNEGPNSPFANNETVTNCDFHRWSWQKFLWLTNDIGGRPLFLDSLYQITAEGDTLNKKQVILRDVAQASGKTDVLLSNKNLNADGTQDTVYYSIHVIPKMYRSMVAYGNKIKKGDTTNLKYSAFPVGSLELKVSWLNARALRDTSSYFMTDGMIHGKKARIALLGMHVVGVVENHPEFIWATFEHRALAPDYDWTKAMPDSDAVVTADKDYPLFAKGAMATARNITPKNRIHTDVFSVYKFGVPIQKTSNSWAFLNTSQSEPANFTNIWVINEDVRLQLKDIWNNYFYNGSIWINTGGFDSLKEQATMLDGLSYNLSQSDSGKLTRGSVSVYNITMETYVQVGFDTTSTIHGNIDANNLVNCFSCHNTNSVLKFNTPLLFSHVFSGYLLHHNNGATKEQVKQEHVEAIKRQFLMRSKQ